MFKITPNPPETDEPVSCAQSARNKKVALGILPVIELSELLANRALDIVEVR